MERWHGLWSAGGLGYSIWCLLSVARPTSPDFSVYYHDAVGNDRVGHGRSDYRDYGGTNAGGRMESPLGFDLYLGNHDDP